MPPLHVNADLSTPFTFVVGFGSSPQPTDCSFLEASGVSMDVESESMAEGGENRFVHQRPAAPKHARLVLQRGVCGIDSQLLDWCREVLEGGLGRPIRTQSLTVWLLDMAGQPLRSWSFADAFPVMWRADAFNSTENQIAIERIELSYGFSKREA